MAQILPVAEVSRQTVFAYRDKVVEGKGGLLRRKHGEGVGDGRWC